MATKGKRKRGGQLKASRTSLCLSRIRREHNEQAAEVAVFQAVTEWEGKYLGILRELREAHSTVKDFEDALDGFGDGPYGTRIHT